MLKLLVFAPCELALASSEETASLINIIEGLRIEVREQLPDDAMIPMKWAIVTLWHRLQDFEADTKFEQRIDVISGQGNPLISQPVEFIVSNKDRNYRNILQHSSFPLHNGPVLCKLYLKSSDSGEWEEKAEYPIDVDVIMTGSIPPQDA
jgi:hypothetical protein